MYYDSMPLYPHMRPEGEGMPCVRLPVFEGSGRGARGCPEACLCQRVTIENPCRPGERADVLLGVDECGNLTVCVRRDCRPSPKPCPPPDPCRPCPPPRPCPPDPCRPCPPDPCRPYPPPRPCPPPRNPCDGHQGRLYGTWPRPTR